MIDGTFDLLGVGGALIDIFSCVPNDFLVQEGLPKASMRLADLEEVDRLRSLTGPNIEVSGGCSANTCVGMRALGSNVCFVGKVADDVLGTVFRENLLQHGVFFDTRANPGPPYTGRCNVLVTPDAERTMVTCLGASMHLTPDDISEEMVAKSGIVLTEAYLFDVPAADEIMRKIISVASSTGSRLAVGLSAASCVDRWRGNLLGLIRNGLADIIFCNRDELLALYQTDDLVSAISCLKEEKSLAVVTLSDKGALLISQGNVSLVPAYKADCIVDCTGAGDFFAAGFLYGEARGMPHVRSVFLGHIMAAEVIGQIGTRPSTADLVRSIQRRGFTL